MAGLSTKLLFLIMLTITAGAAHVPGAHAQEATIVTSADDFGGRFFGEGVLQVVITKDSGDTGTIEDVTVNVDAGPETGSGGSGSFAIPETSESSGRFEFYLAHVDANDINPDDIDPINTAGVEGAAGAGSTAAPIITFGPAAAGADLAVEGAEDMHEDVSFEITADNAEIEVSYEESVAGLTLDRDAYGSNSFVYISVHDNDANLNPTARDEFTVDPGAAPNSDLFELSGGAIAQAVIFEETGDNTAIFEGRYQLGSSITSSSKSLALLLNDKANYGAASGATENDSNYTVQVGFTIGDTSGSVAVNEGQAPAQTYDPVFSAGKDAYMIGESVRVNITDPDANVNADAADAIEVSVMALSSGQEKEMEAAETGADTGVFALSFSLMGSGASTPDAIKVENGDAVVIEYRDPEPADDAPAREFSLQIDIVGGMEGIEATAPTKPVLKDITGGTLTSLTTGQQAVLSTTIENNNDQAQPFVALVEVRNSDGITVFLEWQTGTLSPSGQAEVGLSWTPERAGSYSVRTFVISGFSEAEVLSPVAKSSITVT